MIVSLNGLVFDKYEDQQQEIFDDIVANTNPVLAAMPNAQ